MRIGKEGKGTRVRCVKVSLDVEQRCAQLRVALDGDQELRRLPGSGQQMHVLERVASIIETCKLKIRFPFRLIARIRCILHELHHTLRVEVFRATQHVAPA